MLKPLRKPFSLRVSAFLSLHNMLPGADKLQLTSGCLLKVHGQPHSPSFMYSLTIVDKRDPEALFAKVDKRDPLFAKVDKRDPLFAKVDKRDPLFAKVDKRDPLFAKVD